MGINKYVVGNIIWLIDDDELSNLTNSFILKHLDPGIEIRVIPSAWEAINLLDIHKSNRIIPDLIFVDIYMPLINGFAFLEKFEKDYGKDFEKCRVIVLSNTYKEEDKIRALTFKTVVAFVNKPINENKFKTIIKPLLELKFNQK